LALQDKTVESNNHTTAPKPPPPAKYPVSFFTFITFLIYRCVSGVEKPSGTKFEPNISQNSIPTLENIEKGGIFIQFFPLPFLLKTNSPQKSCSRSFKVFKEHFRLYRIKFDLATTEIWIFEQKSPKIKKCRFYGPIMFFFILYKQNEAIS